MIAAALAIFPIAFVAGLLYLASCAAYRYGLPVLRFVVRVVDRLLSRTERAVDRAAEAWTGTPEVLRGERDA